MRPPTKVARGRCRWSLPPRPAGPARAPGPGEVLPGNHPAVRDTGGSARGTALQQGRTPRRARHEGGAAPDSGLSSRGNLPRAAPRSFLSHPPRPGLDRRWTRGPRARPGRISAAPTPASSKGRAALGPAASPVGLERSNLARSSSAAMTNLPTTPSPGELMTAPIPQVHETLSPQAEEASTALIAVVITVVFLTLLSVVTLIFFYLYKNKGSYVTYEPAEGGEPSVVLQMESDSAKGREEYFI